MMQALKRAAYRIEAAWYILTARYVMGARLKRGKSPEQDTLWVWNFGDWQPRDLEEVGLVAAGDRDEELAEELVKELLNG